MELSGQMILFARVVEEGSFSAAARQLDQTPSAISRHIARLEDQLGVRLLTRSGRGITTTEEGRRFYERCQIVAAEVSEAKNLINGLSNHPVGKLKVVCTTAFAKSQVMPILPQFMAQQPDVTLSFSMTDAPFDINSGDADVAIRFSEQIDGQSAITRKLTANRRILVAAPEYLSGRPAPRSFSELKGHSCLRLSMVSNWNDWIPHSATRTFEANSTDGIYHAALAGLGIARLSTYLVNADLEKGSLVRVCPTYQQDDSNIMLLFADRRNMSPKVRSFINFMVENFGPVPPWERSGQLHQLAG